MLQDELQKRLEGDIEASEEEIRSHSTDWSLFKMFPELVVYPKHADDIGELIRFVNEWNKNHNDHTVSVTARAAGSDMTGGPLNTSIIVDVTRYMRGLKEVKRIDSGPTQQSFFGHTYQITGEATVLPGTYYRDFESETLKDNLIMPCYPASRDLCAVGGMVANNGAGEKTLRYGQNKDFVKELKAVFADGNEYTVQPLTKQELEEKMEQNTFEAEVYKGVYKLVRDSYKTIQNKKPNTSKNAAGYYLWDVIDAPSFHDFERGEGYFDLTKLIVGAQGTTAIITEITYKLVDVQPNHDLLVMYMRDTNQVPKLVETLTQYDLEMLELYDDNTFKIGTKFFKDFVKDKGVIGGIKYTLRFLPEAWMAITKGVPKLIVLAEFTCNCPEKELHKRMEDAEAAVADIDGVATRKIPRDANEEKFWDFRHDSFKILTEHSSESRESGSGSRTAPFIDDIVVNPEHLPEYLPRLIEILDSYDLLYTIAGHLGNGNFHIIPLMELDRISADLILEVSEKVYSLALEYDASITAEHNDGIIRTPYLEQMFGKTMVGLFNKTKKVFDPDKILNPGKKVDGDFEAIRDYIDTTDNNA